MEFYRSVFTFDSSEFNKEDVAAIVEKIDLQGPEITVTEYQPAPPPPPVVMSAPKQSKPVTSQPVASSKPSTSHQEQRKNRYETPSNTPAAETSVTFKADQEITQEPRNLSRRRKSIVRNDPNAKTNEVNK